MFDILTNIFKNPGNSFSPLPLWFLNDTIDAEEAIRQLSAFHIKGVNGVIIAPRMGFDPEIGYLTDKYMDLMEQIAAAAAKKRMMIAFSDDAMYPTGSAHGMVVKANPLFAARCLFAAPKGTHPLAAGEEVLFSLPLTAAFDLAEPGEDAADYDFILSFTGGRCRGLRPDEDDGMPNAPFAADLLNPDAVDAFIANTHEKYHARLSSHFGSTIIGFYSDDPDPAGRGANMSGKLLWTYDLLEDFRKEGGTESHIAALLLPSPNKRKKRDGENIYRRTIRRRLGRVFYGKLSDWCQKHGVALMGHPTSSADCEQMKHFDIPGQDLFLRSVAHGEELLSPDSVLAKCAADSARHMGAARNSVECFGMCGAEENPLDFTGSDMMHILNFLFARGVNMVIPHAFHYASRTPDRPPEVGMHSSVWENQKPLSSYIKRMCWLNAMNYNNPCCAVLCSSDFMPVKAVAPLYENGYTFNYLTMDDVMERARIHDGKIHIDRYSYDVLLIDSRLRLDPAIVLKLGRMVTEGGKMYRGNDFISFLRKNVKKTSFFEPTKKDEIHAKNIRFLHLTKSGYPFFLCFNEGEETVSGHIVTDKSGLCRVFDPFTGDTAELLGELCPDGIRYPVTVKPNTVVILGINTDVLPTLGKNPEKTITEIVSLPVSLGEASFDYIPAEGKTCRLTFTNVHDGVRITVNGTSAGCLTFEPFEIDITPLLHNGQNTVTAEPLPTHAADLPELHCAAEIYI